MTSRHCLRVERDEGGAFLIVWALLIIALMMMVAIVIDLGQARNTHRYNQQIADFAALSAGNTLEATGSGQQACLDAFASIRSNADLPSGSPNCNPMAARCSATTPTRTVAFNSGEWSVTFVHPVPSTDDVMNDPRRADAERDGDPCERFKVRVERVQDTLFGGVGGFRNLTTSGTAIARSSAEREREVPSLWLLDPHDCTSLNVSGGSVLRVGLAAGDSTVPGSSDSPGEPALGPPVGGFVTIDSDGTRCTGTQVSLDSDNSSLIRAVPAPPGQAPPPPDTALVSGAIRLWALDEGTSGCPASDDPTTPDKDESHACQSGDTSGPVNPVPTALDTRATRSPIDHRYNCRGGTPYPDFHGIAMETCPSTRPAFVDQMRAAVGGTTYGAATNSAPTGFTTVPAAGLLPNCNPSGAIVLPAGNYFVDCPTLSIGNGTTVTFAGGNLVFRGGIKLTGSGVLNVNTANPTSTLNSACRDVFCATQSSAHAAFLYQRSGDLEMTGGVLNVNRTMVYQDNGSVKVTGGAPPSWTAPKEAPLGGTFADLCTTSMPCSPFQGLALWSEKSADYTINGGGTLNLEGVFFTPEAQPFKLTGGGGFTPLRAQFIAYQLTVSGGGTLRLVPDARQHVPQSRRAAILIR
jgi:hypothetical protein